MENRNCLGGKLQKRQIDSRSTATSIENVSRREKFSADATENRSSLPKSKFLDSLERTIPKSDGIKKICRLPPPNMKYYAKMPVPSFQWTPPYHFSGLHLEDNSVVLMGTKQYDGILQQSFCNYLQGRQEDLYDFVSRKLCSDRELQSKVDIAYNNMPSKDQLCSSSNGASTSGGPTVNKKSNFGKKIFLPDLSCKEHKTEDINPAEVTSIAGVLHEQPGLVHPDVVDHYLSSSSDEDLPRVQITRRRQTELVEQQQHEAIGCDQQDAGSLETGVSPSIPGTIDDTVTTLVSIAVPDQCPICGMSFPPGITQCLSDEHIANCLSISINDFEDDPL